MIPSVAVHGIWMLALVVPIALVEAIVLARRLGLRYGESCRLALMANVASTVVGLPIGYLCALLGLIPVGIFAQVLPESIQPIIGNALQHAAVLGGFIPHELDRIGYFLGTLLVMIPYFLVTLRIERAVIARRRPALDTRALKPTVRIMNDITYGVLALVVVAGAIDALVGLVSA